MEEAPPPPYTTVQGPSAQDTTQTAANACPQKPGAPMQAVYYPRSSTGPAVTTTTTRTIVQQQPPAVIYGTPSFGYRDMPVQIKCPICTVQVVTTMEFTSGALNWAVCCGLTVVGCVGGCCLIPFCMKEMKDVTHVCPNCQTIVGVYYRM